MGWDGVAFWRDFRITHDIAAYRGLSLRFWMAGCSNAEVVVYGDRYLLGASQVPVWSQDRSVPQNLLDLQQIFAALWQSSRPVEIMSAEMINADRVRADQLVPNPSKSLSASDGALMVAHPTVCRTPLLPAEQASRTG